jgi:hypothetical protein
VEAEKATRLETQNLTSQLLTIVNFALKRMPAISADPTGIKEEISNLLSTRIGKIYSELKKEIDEKGK